MNVCRNRREESDAVERKTSRLPRSLFPRSDIRRRLRRVNKDESFDSAIEVPNFATHRLPLFATFFVVIRLPFFAARFEEVFEEVFEEIFFEEVFGEVFREVFFALPTK